MENKKLSNKNMNEKRLIPSLKYPNYVTETKYALFDKDGRGLLYKHKSNKKELCAFSIKIAKELAKMGELGIENKDYHFIPILEVKSLDELKKIK